MFSVVSWRNNASIKYCTELKEWGAGGLGWICIRSVEEFGCQWGRGKQGAIEFTLLIVNSTGGSTLNYWDGAMVGLGILPTCSATEEIPPFSGFV